MTAACAVCGVADGCHCQPLFPAADAYNGDPLMPDTETVTPLEVVSALPPRQRKLRVLQLMRQAREILADAEMLAGDREIVARCILFSGGNDSTTLAHLMLPLASHAIHANTGIGIEATRQFVRDTCKTWGLPLIEKHPPPGSTYREMVLEHGFPGPGMHWKMYTRLKERCLDQARADLITNPRHQRVMFIAGRRREESKRRATVPLYEVDGSAIWASPIAMWTKLDLLTYREMFNVPRNRVSEALCMSGECLCGAFAAPGEINEIGLWFPEVRAEIEALEADVRAAGHLEPVNRWGHGQGVPSKSGRMCDRCDARQMALTEGS